jgi:hypothetical protein
MATQQDIEDISVAKFVIKVAVGIIVGLMVIVFGISVGLGAYGRWSKVQEANTAARTARIEAANQAQVNQLLINSADQQIQIHQKQAQIRLADAVGVREAQDEISKTLTPLYVQFEMVDALKSIAESGKNNTVVYIPTGANGIPLISNTDPTQQSVGTPKG